MKYVTVIFLALVGSIIMISNVRRVFVYLRYGTHSSPIPLLGGISLSASLAMAIGRISIIVLLPIVLDCFLLLFIIFMPKKK
jgi:Na+/glutamate symporter